MNIENENKLSFVKKKKTYPTKDRKPFVSQFRCGEMSNGCLKLHNLFIN